MSWTDPDVRRRDGMDSHAQHAWLEGVGLRLARWPPAPFEEEPTDCFQVGDDYWIWQPGVGGIQFRADRPAYVVFPSESVDPTWFDHLVSRSWLPAVYQVWGRQVLHASAAAETNTGEVVAFAGPSGAGKSTLAYGLGRRERWAAVSDDTLAFSTDERGISLHPLPNEARLRPASAEYFGRSGARPRPVPWPSGPLNLRAIYFLFAADTLSDAVRITPLKAADAYPLLLAQAHAFTLSVAEHNQRLMRDYLTVASAIPICRLDYHRSFTTFEAVLDGVEAQTAILAPQNTASTT